MADLPGRNPCRSCPKRRDAGEVPLTEGRDLLEPTLWNAWVQPVYVQVSDERYGLDIDTHLGSVTVGLDRRFGENVVLGASLRVSEQLDLGVR